MPFRVPTFNLKCNIWNSPDTLTDPPTISDVDCQLYFPKQDMLEVTPSEMDFWHPPMYLRLPKGTDVRFDALSNTASNFVEVPAGTGRHYDVICVDDAHKGFPNEYRVATLIWHDTPPFPLP